MMFDDHSTFSVSCLWKWLIASGYRIGLFRYQRPNDRVDRILRSISNRLLEGNYPSMSRVCRMHDDTLSKKDELIR